MNNDPERLKRLADAEDGCPISVGGSMWRNSKTCKIKWIDKDGHDTADENPAIGFVRCLGYPVKSQPTFKPQPSEWFPICAEHLKKMPLDGYWEFRRQLDN